jgi:type IV pilus assembly protein PilW
MDMTMNENKYIKGLSLVEMMVAILISTLLAAAMFTLFISNKKAYTESERFARMQDNARHAMHVLTNELRLVDFWGAARRSDLIKDGSLDAMSSDCTGLASAHDFRKALFSINTGDTNTAIGCITTAKKNTDVLMVKHVHSTPTDVGSLSANSSYVMSNVQQAVLFDGGDTPPSTSKGGKVPGGQAWEYQARAYYISNPASADDPPSLHRKILQNSSMNNDEEIAEGIENFRILFGEDTGTDGEADKFVSSASVSDWDKVTTMRIYLLMRSAEADAAYTDNKTYNLGDITITNPNDNYHRTVVSSTVTLRNPQIVLKGGF